VESITRGRRWPSALLVLVAALTAASCGRDAPTGAETSEDAAFVVLPGGGRLTATSGNQQTADAGTALPQPVVVRVTDDAGRGLSGVAVSWAVTVGGGALTAVQTATDAGGYARARATPRCPPSPSGS
jgi:hypothetical protein